MKCRKSTILIHLILISVGFSVSSCENSDVEILAEMEYSLKHDLLDVWYPLCIDSMYGGYLSDFTYNWTPEGRHDKMLVTQSRHIWTLSNASMFYNNDRYRIWAKQGVDFLLEKMWDKELGGFYEWRDREGNPLITRKDETKSAYSNAFAIYALSAYYKLTGNKYALERAQETFYWLEKHSYDPINGGYFDNLTRDGNLQIWPRSKSSINFIGKPHWKNQNSSIHLLEAFTSLYQLWPDDLLRKRLHSLLILIKDTMVTKKGYLKQFFEPDWTPISLLDSSQAVREANYYFDHVSFGHDVETAYLLLEAIHSLGMKDDKHTKQICKKMIDHAFDNGWDEESGGYFYQGFYFKNSDSVTIVDKKKEWWVQAEALNSLLLMIQIFPEELKYQHRFSEQWKYIQNYIIDHDYGGWYSQGIDITPEVQQAVKGNVWKTTYHNYRALSNCIKILKSED